MSDVQFGRHVDLCHSPSTSANAHEVGHPHTYPKPHFTSLINISDLSREMLRAPVGKVCFGGDLLHRQLVVTDRLLEPQVLDLDVLRFAQALFCLIIDSAALESMCSRIGTATQVFGKRLNSH